MADNRIAYGLAKKYGIDTEGMSPKEVWEALEKKGVKELGGHGKDENVYKSVEELKKQQERELPKNEYKLKAAEGKANTESRKQKLTSFKSKDDGTYSLETGRAVSYDDGYQVSFQQSSDNYTDEEFDKKVEELINRTGSEAHVGVFGGEPEISFHVRDIKAAMQIAVEYNQHSIWNWKRGRIIKNRKYNPETNRVNKE